MNRGVLAQLRDVVPLRALTRQEALSVAERQALKLLELTGTIGGPVHERIIAELPRIHVERMSPWPVSGATHWVNGRWIIVLNGAEPVVRQRFSLAHELKHIIDHPFVDTLYRGIPEADRHDFIERTCDYFAGRIFGGDLSEHTYAAYEWDTSSADQRARERMWLDAEAWKWRKRVTMGAQDGVARVSSIVESVLGPQLQRQDYFEAREALHEILQRLESVDKSVASSVASSAQLRPFVAMDLHPVPTEWNGAQTVVHVNGPLDLSGCGRVLLPSAMQVESLHLGPDVGLLGGDVLTIAKDFTADPESAIERWPRVLTVDGDLDLSKTFGWNMWPEVFNVAGSLMLGPQALLVGAPPNEHWSVTGAIHVDVSDIKRNIDKDVGDLMARRADELAELLRQLNDTG